MMKAAGVGALERKAAIMVPEVIMRMDAMKKRLALNVIRSAPARGRAFLAWYSL